MPTKNQTSESSKKRQPGKDVLAAMANVDQQIEGLDPTAALEMLGKHADGIAYQHVAKKIYQLVLEPEVPPVTAWLALRQVRAQDHEQGAAKVDALIAFSRKPGLPFEWADRVATRARTCAGTLPPRNDILHKAWKRAFENECLIERAEREGRPVPPLEVTAP